MALTTTFSRDNCRKAHQGNADFEHQNIAILFKYKAPVMFLFFEVRLFNITEAPILAVLSFSLVFLY